MNWVREDIRDAIGDQGAFSRGIGYFVGGKVLMVEANEYGLISAKVSGSGERTYSVKANIVTDRDGRLLDVHGKCSCPVGYNCKHVVAALLEAESRLQEQKIDAAIHKNKAGAGALSGDLQVWLEALSSLQSTEADSEPVLASRNALFYVFRRKQTGAAEIVLYKAYLKKDGTIGKNVSEYNLSGSAYSTREQTLEDAIILAQMRFYTPYTFSSLHAPDWPQGERLGDFLQLITSTGRARAGDIRGAGLVWSKPRHVSFHWETDEAGNQELLALDEAGKAMELLHFPDPVFMDESEGLIGFVKSDLPAGMLSVFAQAPIVSPANVAAVSKALKRQGNSLPVPSAIKITEKRNLTPQAHLRLYGYEHKIGSRYMPGGMQGVKMVYPCARLFVRYKGVKDPLPVNDGRGEIYISDKGSLTIVRRNGEMENELIRQLEIHVVDFESPDPVSPAYQSRKPEQLAQAHVIFAPVLVEENQTTNQALDFMARILPQLQSEGWEIEFDPSWPFILYEGEASFHTDFEPSGSSLGMESGSDWFALALKLNLDGMELDLTPTVLQIIESLPLDGFGELRESFDINFFLSETSLYLQLPDGRFVPIAGNRLAGFVEAFLEVNGLMNFHRAETGRAVSLAEALDGCGAPWNGGKEILALGKSLQKLDDPQEIQPPSELKAELRPYQKVGYGWLRALSDNALGGILADDMGLGKTIQALSLLVQRCLVEKVDKPSLLIVPTSLIGNWLNEVNRFAPDLKLLVLHGPDRRNKFDEIHGHHLVLTTYPLVNRDFKDLFQHEYDLAILDEAQAVKNPASNIAKRIRDIKARQRIALTGTPLENNLAELWSLYDWLIPGFLGNRKKFGTDYRIPIERHGDQVRQRQLSRRLKPFLLRRTKDEVASDLPPKSIIDEVITLGGKQAALYESVRAAMDKRVRDAIKSKGLAGSHITVLDALLKLRQVCCDPSLVKLQAAAKVRESAKRDRLMEMLLELVPEGRRILIFSQFVEMLRLLEADIQAAGWDYAMLHGQTKKRTEEIERFQSGEVSIFLISLKAGGTGLNLTAADTIILFDPWWNPAVERQAMDRAHRIGQDKPIFVHRLLACDTVETAIQAMQADKQALADALFEGTAGGPMSLSEDDLSELFGAR